MSRTYSRDAKGRFAPTGGVKMSAVGRGKRPVSNRGRARLVGGKPTFESRSVIGSQKGVTKIGKSNIGVTAVTRYGLQSARGGKAVKPVRVDSYVAKIKKRGYTQNAPSHRIARRASGAKGVQIGPSSRYVSNREANQALGGNMLSRSIVRRSSGTLPRSGYIVSSTATPFRRQ